MPDMPEIIEVYQSLYEGLEMDDAFSKRHSHTNKATLDSIPADFMAKSGELGNRVKALEDNAEQGTIINSTYATFTDGVTARHVGFIWTTDTNQLILSQSESPSGAFIILYPQSYANIPIVQEPFKKSYAYNGNSNVFTLPKIPDVIIEVVVLDGTESRYILKEEDYTVDKQAATVTINAPALTDAMSIKISYTAKGGAL